MFDRLLHKSKSKKQELTEKPETITIEALGKDVLLKWMMQCLQFLGEMSAQAFDDIPQEGRFKKRSFCISLSPENEPLFLIHVFAESDADVPKLRRLSVGVTVPQSDVCVSNYCMKGTTEEMLSYLKEDFCSDAMLDRVQMMLKKLMDKID